MAAGGRGGEGERRSRGAEGQMGVGEWGNLNSQYPTSTRPEHVADIMHQVADERLKVGRKP